MKGQAGRFRVTPKQHVVLVRINRGEEWETLFVEQLPASLKMSDGEGAAVSIVDSGAWLSNAKPGDVYLLPAKLEPEKWNYRQKRGGIITKKIKNGEVFARAGADASDPEKGENANILLAAIKTLSGRGKPVTQLEHTVDGHVLYRHAGLLHFIAALTTGLEFPE